MPFDPVTYSRYNRTTVENDRQYTYKLQKGDFAFGEGGELVLNHWLAPLQPNNHLLLETIHHLNPLKVMEVGCGNADNLHNLSLILPDVLLLHGIDVSTEQLEWAKERNPHIAVAPEDLTQPIRNGTRYTLAFAHTVLMHIEPDEAYIEALKNLFWLATRRIVLIENWETHAFAADILALVRRREVTWKRVYLYYRESAVFGRPQILIASSEPLGDFYTPLDDYNATFVAPQLADPLANIGRLSGQSGRYPQPCFAETD